MRNTVFISSELALAEPVPLTFAILRTKSFTRLFCCFATLPLQVVLRRCAYGIVTVDFCMSHAPVGQRSAHSPQCTHKFSSFSITRAVCLSGAETKSCCSTVEPRRFQPLRELCLGAVRRNRQAVDGTNVDAGVALDAKGCREHRLQVAVQAALDLRRDLLGAEAELDLDVELLETLLEIDVRHDAPRRRAHRRCCSSTRGCPSWPS